MRQDCSRSTPRKRDGSRAGGAKPEPSDRRGRPAGRLPSSRDQAACPGKVHFLSPVRVAASFAITGDPTNEDQRWTPTIVISTVFLARFGSDYYDTFSRNIIRSTAAVLFITNVRRPDSL